MGRYGAHVPSTHLWLPPYRPRGCSYVQLAVRLGRDARYRGWAGELIRQRSAVLWERKDVVFEWARFLSRAAGRPSPTADEVFSCGQNASTLSGIARLGSIKDVVRRRKLMARTALLPGRCFLAPS